MTAIGDTFVTICVMDRWTHYYSSNEYINEYIDVGLTLYTCRAVKCAAALKTDSGRSDKRGVVLFVFAGKPDKMLFRDRIELFPLVSRDERYNC